MQWVSKIVATLDLSPRPPPIWTRSEDKIFENALLEHPEGTPNRWEMIARKLQGKCSEDVKAHYQALVHDVEAIESGKIEPPNYDDNDNGCCDDRRIDFIDKREAKKRGKPWTIEEHKAFLKGICEGKRGDWNSISEYYVKTRTPTQIASHAQKYYNRQQANRNGKSRRKSIHDIT